MSRSPASPPEGPTAPQRPIARAVGDAAWIDRVLAGKYIVEGVLGRGGMGLVLKARHLRLDELVAIKVLHASLVNDESMAARMLREARAALRLSSEHVVRVMDVDTLENGTPFMVMEYLEGTDVSSLARRRGGTLPFDQAAAIAEQTCRALAEAHALGIVHRDLKPANLFVVERPDGRRVVKLLDFGISKVNVPREAPITKKGDILGSPRYMSPEQVRGETLDGRADLWSVGVVLYELLAGKPPFEGPNFAVTCRRVLDATPEPLATLRPDVPPGLCAVIDRCLEKDRERRFPDALALRDALSPFGPLSSRTGSLSGIADLGTWSAPTSANSLVPVVGLLSVAPPASSVAPPASSSVAPPASSSAPPPPSSSVPPPASSGPGAPPAVSSVPPPSVTRPSAAPPAIPRAAVPPPPLSSVSGASPALAASGASAALSVSGASAALSTSGASAALSTSGASAALSASSPSPSVEPGAATSNAPPPAGSDVTFDAAITAWALAPPRRSRTFVGFAIAGLCVGVATGVVVLARETDSPAPAATAPPLPAASAQSASDTPPAPPSPATTGDRAAAADPAAPANPAAPQPTASAAALKDPSHSEPSLAEPAPAQAARDVRTSTPPRNKPTGGAKPAAAPIDPFGERRK